MMLEDDELHYQPKPIKDSDKVAREIAYDDTIHVYIDKRTEQLKE